MGYSLIIWSIISAGYYVFKVDNKSTRARCGICSKLTIKTPERRFFGTWNFFTKMELLCKDS